MSVLIPMLITLIVVAIVYQWMKKREKELTKWIPEVPQNPIFGNLLEVANPTDILEAYTRYLNDHNGLCAINIIIKNFVLVSDPRFLEFVLGKWDILKKTDEYDFLSSWLGSGLLIAKEPIWRKRRKMLTPSFHFSNLENFINIIEKCGDTLIELLEKETLEERVDISKYTTNCTLDIICEAAMGVSINAQINPNSEYVKAVHAKCKFLIERTYSIFKRYDILYRLTPTYYFEKSCDEILHNHTMRVINSRKERLEREKDKNVNSNDNEDVGLKKRKVFLDMLLEYSDNGQNLTDQDIREEVDTFMFAGHDTTATALSFSLYCLSLNKDVQDKVVEEQKRIFGNDKDKTITNRDLLDMTYLDLVLKECLRLYPSVPYIGRKTDKDLTYKDGKVIPAGTSILLVIYSLHRNPKYFPDPEKFDPSRFEDTTHIPVYAYLPFSAGPRNCIGQRFAWNVIKSVISKVLRNYEVLPCGHPLKLSAVAVLRSENGVGVKLRKRNWDEIPL
ncbi:cytochrome P450 4c3-like [Diorhabda sublineata]|uniref:cytochrome P450 4c3-like n=1 Tax=Diorhabda sublineata TaxID=1163346 RepID=UPI0024E135B1|nr:cytochrome P450 4c3-like [Diorhabda sublineata]XP_056647384.1 cytochrome P450 4c3-like [Diorhabda sublineata]XP_056647390.1 cytochrome P450 4c3-like [Diorhabda sublineata]XP_056647392.1 cytochrome P450 4c3-like [Diorhabda sublineata]